MGLEPSEWMKSPSYYAIGARSRLRALGVPLYGMADDWRYTHGLVLPAKGTVHAVVALTGGVLQSLALRTNREAAIALAKNWADHNGMIPSDEEEGAWMSADGDDDCYVLPIEIDGDQY